jgi:hypothetical protein
VARPEALVKVRQSTFAEVDCLRKLQYNLESNYYHGGSKRAVGTAYHYGHEVFYEARMAELELPSLELIKEKACDKFDRTALLEPSHESELTKQRGEFKWDEDVPDHGTAYRLIESMLEAYFFEHVWPEDWQVLGVELGFSLPFWGEHTRNGSIDLVLMDPVGYVVGVDDKTAGKRWNDGKHTPRRNAQASWYVTALQYLFPDAMGYRFVFDIMTYKGVFERRVSDPQPEHQAATDRRAIEVVTLYEGMRAGGMDLPANPASTLCSPRYCDHWDVCPYGAVLDH